jgi:hypothetical protein
MATDAATNSRYTRVCKVFLQHKHAVIAIFLVCVSVCAGVNLYRENQQIFLYQFPTQCQESSALLGIPTLDTSDPLKETIIQHGKDGNHITTHPKQLSSRYIPKKSIVEDFPTAALEAEIRKHDRLIVHGVTYVNSLTPQELQRWIPNPARKPQLCMNVYVCNRDVPYMDAFLMTLMKSTADDPAKLTSYAHINLINTEHRPRRQSFPHLHQTLSQLPFINIVNVSTVVIPGHRHMDQRELPYRKQVMVDYIKGLHVCLQSNLTWCLMMEGDSVVPLHFIDYLQTFVIQPEGNNPQGAMISLYSYYNLNSKGNRSLDQPWYSETQYARDRAQSNRERQAAGLEPYQAHFTVRTQEFHYGAVALLYTRDVVQKAMDFMISHLKSANIASDVLLNRYFPAHMQVNRRQVEPSLVNHIGFYSDRIQQQQHKQAKKKKTTMFAQLSTDVRFQLDAGEMMDPNS